jgi:Flp pilus assembly protein TadD
VRANDPNETPIRYDLYRIPFNNGAGGRAEPIAGASANGRSNSFPKVSPDGKWIVWVQSRNGQLMRPDSTLWIVPAGGGQARRMNCNTPLMNSWHSFSPNGRWMVFSSKSSSPYTQMFLTHIDDNGNDTPAILIENATAANRAVNIPEFVNIAPDGLLAMDAPATDYYRVVDTASALASQGKRAEAVAEWRKALELAPSEALAHNNLAIALVETGGIEEAMAHYRKALELSPEYPEAHNNLGEALIRSQRHPEAIEQFRKALELNPDYASAHSNLGAALAQTGRMAEALPHFEKSAELKPDDADIRNNLAVTLALTGRVKDAIPHLEHAVKLSGGREPMMLDLLAQLYANAGRITDAIAAQRRALAAATRLNDERLIAAIKARLARFRPRKKAS